MTVQHFLDRLSLGRDQRLTLRNSADLTGKNDLTVDAVNKVPEPVRGAQIMLVDFGREKSTSHIRRQGMDNITISQAYEVYSGGYAVVADGDAHEVVFYDDR